MIRLMLKLLSVLLITVCGAPNGYVSAEPGRSIPAPTEPAWITRDNVNEFNELDKEAFKALDFFVLMAASEATLDPNRDPAEVELARKEALGLAVLATKYALARLFYDVSLDSALHPVDDHSFTTRLWRSSKQRV